MIDRGKKPVLGVLVSAVDYEAAVSRISTAAKARKPLAVTALAVHGVMTGVLDRAQRSRINGLDMVVPDGQPVRWALWLLHREVLPDRVYGPRLTALVCEAAATKGLSVYFYGSRRDVVEQLVKRTRQSYPDMRIAGWEASKFKRLTTEENQQILERIRASGADIIFVGLGCPRQEAFVFENRNAVGRPLVAVGAAFDFHAGVLRQAPQWMQSSGLEWVFRLVVEPKRLWRRYVYLNPLFCALIAGEMLGLRWESDGTNGVELERMRYG